ncbi:MAG TPA: dihydrofolate reductase [Candidatus Saccharimonadales bacterium]
MIAIVVATDENGIIGQENKIPWVIRKDFIRLKKLTQGHTVILGRKTYESMDWYYNRSGRDMPGAMYLVLTRDEAFRPTRANAQVVHSVEEAIATANSLGDPEVYVIGGGSVFNALLPYANRVYLTLVHTKLTDGDATFPPLKDEDWNELSIENHTKDDKNEFDFDIVTLERKKGGLRGSA